MRRKLKRVLCAVLAAAMLWLPGGCTSARELNELVIVMGIGMDQGDEPESIRLTAQIVLPGKISTPQKGGSSTEDPYYNLSSTAKNTFEAIREYTHLVSGRLYIAHAQVFVIGRELAEQQGISAHLDFFVRAGETRPNTKIVIADTAANDILSVKPKMNMLPATNISKLIEEQIDNSQSRETNLLDYVNAMQSDTASLLVPIIGVTERDGEQVLAVSGMAVFKGDKMVGRLSPEETRGVLWVKNEVQSGVINVEIDGGTASLEVLSAQGKASPVVSDGKVTMKISVSATVELGEQTCRQNLATEENLKKLKELVQNAICNEIAMAYNKAVALRADVFGFGELVHKHNAAEWREMEPRWNDELFPALALNIQVDASVVSAGSVEEPAWSREEDKP